MAEVTRRAAAPGPPIWRLTLLGEAVTLWGRESRWHPGAAAAVLLAYLAVEGATPRERLAGLLWPERPEARARANLRQLLLRIRAAAPIVDGDPLRLAPDVWVDVRALTPDALAGRATGRLLAGLDASRWPGLAEWLEDRQGAHEARVRRALVEAIAAARERRDLAAAAVAAERLSRLDPWSETACRTVMEVALAQQEPATALRAYRRLRRALEQEVGTEPGVETVALARRAARAAGRAQLEPAQAGGDSRRVARRAESGGWLREGAELLLQTAEGLDDGPELARVLTELAWLEHRLGWNRRARTHAQRAVALPGGNVGGGAPEELPRADACFVLGSLAWATGDLAAARDRWGQALRSLRRGDRAARLRLSLDLALVEDALERPEVARRHYVTALELARELGDRPAEAKALNNLGVQLAREGRPADGMTLLLRAHAIARERRDRLLEGYVLDSIARARMAAPTGASGELAAARAAAARAASIAMDAGDVRLQIEAFLTLSRVSVTEGNAAAARRFAEAALARAEAAGWKPLAASAREHLVSAGGGSMDVTPA
ncbi:MAG TPA: BTAD domain-containing putative transcriptional regulator [Trueperaceae bacterium]|nr:BTAD domain-containing putative transcriptional regulator [Trueperaceae bacterium]